jgi:hypothetical protein
MFYRRLDDLLSDQGGKAFCRSTKSAYIVQGDRAKELAYAIGALAERFGAGRVGDANGTVVLPLGDGPDDHFAMKRQAEDVIDTICVDRRKRENRKSPRGLADARVLAKRNSSTGVRDDRVQFRADRAGRKR